MPRDDRITIYENQDYGSIGAIGILSKGEKSQVYVYFKRNLFSNNFAVNKGSCIGTIGGNITDKNSIYYNNSARIVGVFYIHISSYFFLENSNITENSAGDESCISLREFSYFYVIGCYFRNINSVSGKGMIYVDELSEMIVLNSIFENITSEFGNIFYAKFNGYSPIVFKNNSFDNNFDVKKISRESFFFDSCGNVLLEENYFSNSPNRLLLIKNSNLTFKSNRIHNLSCLNNLQIGCVFYITQLSYFFSENSIISGIK